uniref:Origin recognition complex subunit 3 n=1 Tax=Amphiprion ocellaris TaxID=80972 RepID=A0AAQ5X6E9_AMPOC
MDITWSSVKSIIKKWKVYDPHKRTISTVEHGGGSILVWGCVSAAGPGSFVKVEGNTNAEKYHQILEDNLIQSARELRLGRRFIFQQDNDPKHTAKDAQKWFKDNKVNVLDWPSPRQKVNTFYRQCVLQDELNRKILDSLLDFTRKCSSARQHSDWASQMRANEIPTAALVLGVNVPDHDITFQSLSELLHQSVTPHVASVEAKECGALKHLMKRVLERLMDTVVDDDEEEETEHTSTQLHKSVNCSLSALCDWYITKTKRSSPAEHERQQQPPVVIIFKDLEAFNPRVLRDFILICSRYIERLPLMFIFGIATSPSTIQRMLPHSVSSLLCIELFQSLSCTQHLATVIDQLILTPQFPFKLNAKVMQVLLSIFLYHDFSVRNFIKGLQLALLEHFHSQPLSVLCCKKKEALLNVMQLSHRDLERIRQLPSFKRYVEKQESQEQVNLITDDSHLKETCRKMIKGLHKYHKNYYPILKCLHTLTSALPRYPLGKQIRELHLTCLEKNVWENEDYQSAMKLLKMLAKDDLIALLQRCGEILKPVKSKKMKSTAFQLEELLTKFKQLDSNEEDSITSPIKNLQKKTDLFQLQKTLLEMNETRRSKKLSPFEILRNEALEFIDSLVKSHLSPPESQTLHEVCYYSSSATVRRHLNATPRTSIQAALSSPYYYLQNENLKTEDGTVSNAAPDICIAYKLHLECGRLINLYDWLELISTNLHLFLSLSFSARFIRSVSELEFLGFIKSTKQKTDHVARLTWGGC